MELMSPLLLAWWVKLLRESSDLSQEALAEASGLTTRTIQRVEAGEASNTTTRRALARGLGYEDPKCFEDPNVARGIAELRADIERVQRDTLLASYPDKVFLPATKVVTGEELGRLAEGAGAYSFHYDDQLNAKAKATAAALFDYLRDYGEVDELYSETDKLDVYAALGGFLEDLHKMGASAHSATRVARVVGQAWLDKTPLNIRMSYLVIDSSDKEIHEIVAGKQFDFKF